jgi:hypothetical protein
MNHIRYFVERRDLWEEYQGQYSSIHYGDKESTHVSDHDYNIEGGLSCQSETNIYILDLTS